jgi:hypothetical protein
MRRRQFVGTVLIGFARKRALKNARRIIQLSMSRIALLGSTVAYAALSAHLARGEKIVELPVPDRSAEVGIMPEHFPNAAYSGNDLKAESQLRSTDEYISTAVCPKTNSTNLGLDFYSLPQEFTPQQVEASHCKTPGANKIAFRDKNPIVAMLTRNADISTFVGRTFTTDNVQTMVQLKDAADLIVLDTLMNQQNRFGNIHYLENLLLSHHYRPEFRRHPQIEQDLNGPGGCEGQRGKGEADAPEG